MAKREITMATIRAYTTIEQSRKLAEILPLESADMMYLYWTGVTPEGTKREVIEEVPTIKEELPIDSCDIPCWSLASLLAVLPKIHGAKPILDLEENSIQYTGIDLYVVADNSVDACVAMIEKLNELKML